nr:hypothetical protein [Tanacetum cinerariifolium]
MHPIGVDHQTNAPCWCCYQTKRTLCGCGGVVKMCVASVGEGGADGAAVVRIVRPFYGCEGEEGDEEAMAWRRWCGSSSGCDDDGMTR